MSAPHDWKTSTLGHGNLMCTKCFMTDLEAMVLGEYDHCTKAFEEMVQSTKNDSDESPKD